MNRIEELAKEGWERQFIASEPRLSEMVELYKEIGYEVHLEPFSVEEAMQSAVCEEGSCNACFSKDRNKYRIIYTRRRP